MAVISLHPMSSGTERAPAVFAALACLVWLIGASGCDVAGIPSADVTDVGLTEDASPQICTPHERSCEGLEVITCNAEGTAVSSHTCPTSSACVDGYCEPVQTHCDPDINGASPAYSVSKDQLVFEVADVLKPNTASLDITNCGDTPMTIREVRFGEQPTDHSVLPDVFTLVVPALEGLELQPGEQQDITVRYQPQYAYSRQGGSLVVRISGATYQQFSIALTPKTYCVSATPRLDLGLFDTDAKDTIVVHNCGTEPVELTDVHVEANSDEAEDLLDGSLELADDLPTLEAGEHFEFDLQLQARAPGALDHRVIFGIADADRYVNPEPTTELSGRVIAGSCHDHPFRPPQVWGEQLDSTEGWTVDDAPLEQPVFFEIPSEPDTELQPVFSLTSPEGSRAELREPRAPSATSPRNSFVPDVAGRYEVRVDMLDADQRPACEPRVLTVQARPTSDLYVDLRWKTRGDPISTDTGFGYGADLNLYLATSEELARHPAWDDPILGCYGLGEFDAAGGHQAQSNVYQAQCQSADAEIRSLSVSGAHREIMVVEQVSKRFYHIGVRSWSMYDYPRTDAQLSVYADGRRVEQIDLAARWWGGADDDDYRSPPADLGELLHIELSGRQAWHFGVWDAQNNRLLPRPPHRYDGSFP